MPIAFDAATSGPELTGSESSISWLHTCSGTDRHLAVCVRTRDTTATTGLGLATGVTYNGVAMTLAEEIEYPTAGLGNACAQIWSLANPPSGSHSIVVNWGGNVARGGAGAISHTGVSQSSPIAASNSAMGESTVTGLLVSAALAGQVAIDSIYSMATDATATGPGQTERELQQYGVGSFSDLGAISTIGPVGAPGDADFEWTHAGGEGAFWAAAAVVLAEPAGGGEDGETDLAGAAAIQSLAQVLTEGSVSVAAISGLTQAGTAAALASAALNAVASLDAAVQAQVDAAVAMSAASGLQSGAAMVVGAAVNLAVAAAVLSAAGQSSEAGILLGAASALAQEAGLTVQVDTALAADAGLASGSDRLVAIGVDLEASSGLVSSASATAIASASLNAAAAINLLGAAAASAGIEFAAIANIVTDGSTTSGDIITPDGRTYRVVFDSRVLAVAAEDRTLIVTH